ncbi:hypothetical protein DOTSEDRAFT_82630 [Dothistroma septosporum NZE10]|uniref:Uncharacterized protein n=1 Tax=Dothistroma septosporum (strain NZE10 / CBS 128990) TaxID=675120 RepID=N1PBX0_DOTSN|nr:hypothetical protein DOTSEDRAFT_82630 [Dothistroma septosporum NZE10]
MNDMREMERHEVRIPYSRLRPTSILLSYSLMEHEYEEFSYWEEGLCSWAQLRRCHKSMTTHSTSTINNDIHCMKPKALPALSVDHDISKCMSFDTFVKTPNMPSASELRQQAEQPLDPNTPQTYEQRHLQEREQPANASDRSSKATSAPLNEDYEPHPEQSIPLSPERQHVLDSILRLYSGSGTHDANATGAQDMRVYAKKSVYDDILSYCDTRYKIAGQWYGIPAVMKSSVTKAVEVVESTPVADAVGKTPGSVVFKMKRDWTPKLMLGKTFEVNHFVTLSLERAVEEDGEGPSERVKYHKDQWNEKEYEHDGFGKVMKTVNGDYATIGTRPPKDL